MVVGEILVFVIKTKNHLSINEYVFHYELGNFHHWWMDGTLKETFIAGIGCCLMKRQIMKNFEFRSEPNNPNGHPPDTYFAEDLRARGVPTQLCTYRSS
jgi:hypothetical protein